VPFSDVLHWRANQVSGLFQRTRLRHTGHAIGTWLRAFQTATARPAVEFTSGPFLEALDVQLERVRRRHPPTIVSGLSDLGHRLAHQLSGARAAQAARHGDFIPQNILLTEGNKVRIVDLENFVPGASAYEDPGMLFAYLLLLEASPAYSAKAVGACREAFWSAYAPRGDSRQLALHSALAAIRIVTESPCGCSDDSCRHRRQLSSRTAYVCRRLSEIAAHCE